MALAAHTPAGEARGRLSTPRQARPTSKLALASGEGARKLVNRTLRAGSVPGVYDFLDVAYPVESALDSGLWNAPGYTADGTHPTNLGYLAVRQARVIDPMRIRLAR